jgi:hypothetical protein
MRCTLIAVWVVLFTGTHVAGIAMGGIHGVARGAILHPVKVSWTSSWMPAGMPFC